jgi:hypothetical protein
VTDANRDVQDLQSERQRLTQELATFTGQRDQLQQRVADIPMRLETLNGDQATQGSINALTAERDAKQSALTAAQVNLKALEATKALGEATKVETGQWHYQRSQLAQKSGVVAATGVKIGADAVGVATGGAKLAGSLGTFVSSAGVVSTGVSALSLPLDCYSLHRDRLQIQAAKSTLQKVKLAERNPGLQLDATEKAFMKMMKRKLPIADKQFSAAYNSTKVIAGLGGATAVGFKIAVLAGCTVGAITAGAACLTPIGWALAGVAAATLIGYGIFKVSRFIHSKRQQQAYVETVNAPNPLNTPKGRSILNKMVDEHIQLNPNPNPQKPEAQYRGEVEQLVSGSPNINERVRERAEQGLISRSRGFGIELMTDRLKVEGYPPAGRTGRATDSFGC